MGKVTELKPKDICQFCGTTPDHRGFWQCPRIKSVSYSPDDGSWSVEFVLEDAEEEASED